MRSRRNCCVVGCTNNELKCTGTDVKFYAFPSRPWESERRMKWISSIRRLSADGSSWKPTKNSKVCSEHFVGGKISTIENHPAYVPTIFPSQCKRKPSVSTERCERAVKRRRKDPITGCDVEGVVEEYYCKTESFRPDKNVHITKTEKEVKNVLSFANLIALDSSIKTEVPRKFDDFRRVSLTIRKGQELSDTEEMTSPKVTTELPMVIENFKLEINSDQSCGEEEPDDPLAINEDISWRVQGSEMCRHCGYTSESKAEMKLHFMVSHRRELAKRL